jgi:hypothetical protein
MKYTSIHTKHVYTVNNVLITLIFTNIKNLIEGQHSIRHTVHFMPCIKIYEQTTVGFSYATVQMNSLIFDYMKI